MKALKLVPDDININFIGHRIPAYIASSLLVIVSIALLFINGLNFGIDFTGGTLIEIRTDVENPSLPELRSELNDLNIGSVSIQEFGQANDLLIRLPQQEGGPESQDAAINQVKQSLTNKFGDDGVTYRRIEYVGPQVGDELKWSGTMAIVLALAGILVYVTFRFELPFGVSALIALAHDAVATLGLFALTQMEFNLSTVAALLMIAGYSINDTVVVFDRIRENLRKYKKKALPELFNFSVNQTLSRTLMTSVTTFLALLALWIFGGEVIRGFINALLFGVLIGTYSSIFVASPVLLLMNISRNPGENTHADTDSASVQSES